MIDEKFSLGEYYLTQQHKEATTRGDCRSLARLRQRIGSQESEVVRVFRCDNGSSRIRLWRSRHSVVAICDRDFDGLMQAEGATTYLSMSLTKRATVSSNTPTAPHTSE